MKKKIIPKILPYVMIIFLFFSIYAYAEVGEERDESIEGMTRFTGLLNVIFFSMAAVMLPWRYGTRIIKRNIIKNNTSLVLFDNIDSIFKKLHYIIGAGAFFAVYIHAYMLVDRWNFFLLIALSLIGRNVFTGIIFYFKFLSDRIRGWMYKIHVSLIILLIAIILLYWGHISVD